MVIAVFVYLVALFMRLSFAARFGGFWLFRCRFDVCACFIMRLLVNVLV